MDFKTLNTKAWEIRRKAANRLGCKIMVISWKECLALAKAELLRPVETVNIKPLITITGMIESFKFVCVIITSICLFTFLGGLCFAFITSLMGLDVFSIKSFFIMGYGLIGLFTIGLPGFCFYDTIKI